MENIIQEGEQALEGQGGGQTQQQAPAATQQSGSLFGGVVQAGEDGAINTEVNSLLTKEGIPVGADGVADAFIDKEANSFLGGNKNF